MIEKEFEQVSAADIVELLEKETPESRTLEYKQSLPRQNDEDKREFLADVSAFANSSGGDLLFGVTEKRNQEGQSTGLPDVAGIEMNGDAELRRLEAMLQDGIKPRIPGVHSKVIDGVPGGRVLLIRVPKSWARPHMVSFQRLSRFYARNSGGKFQLDVDEIRAAFLATQGLAERLREFRLERIAKVLAGETPVETRLSEPRLVLHLVPLASLDPGSAVDVARAASELVDPMRPMRTSGWDHRFNLDGFVTFGGQATGRPGPFRSYVQVFRRGMVEAVTESEVHIENQLRLVTGDLEATVLDGMERYLRLVNGLGLEQPVSVGVSLLGRLCTTQSERCGKKEVG